MFLLDMLEYMRMKKSQKFVTFETTPATWLALKVEAYKQGKSVKEFLNEVLKKVLPREEGKEKEKETK